jgi:hypothetical protein
MDDSNPFSLVRALEITADIMHLITDAFREHLSALFAILFKPLPRAQHHADRVLTRIASLFPPSEIFQASLTTPHSIPLLHFVTVLLDRNPTLLDASVSGRLLSLSLYACLEGHRDQSSLREAVALLTSIHDQFPSAYQDFAASASPDVQEFLSNLELADPEEDAPPPSVSLSAAPPPDFVFVARIRQTVTDAESANLETLVARLQTDPDKSPLIRSVAACVTAGGGAGLAFALPTLLRLSKSSFTKEIERALQTVGSRLESPVLLDAAVPLLGEEEPEVFIEFLTRVVAAAPREALVPRVREIMGRLAPLLHHQTPVVRKDSVLCIVEMRLVIGQEFDSEVAALKSLPRKLVMHYLERRIAGEGTAVVV